MRKLKIWPEFFQAVVGGEKKAEVRKCEVGFSFSEIMLVEFNPVTQKETGYCVVINPTNVVKLGDVDEELKDYYLISFDVVKGSFHSGGF